MENKPQNHPLDPHSNVPKFGGYDPNKYVLDHVPSTVLTDEALTPGRPPCQTQRTIGKFLQPLTRELVEVPPRHVCRETDKSMEVIRTTSMAKSSTIMEVVNTDVGPTIHELPDSVIDQMVKRDKAFWVDKPGANAYTLHDAYYEYGMTTEMVKPPHQDVFPRSYQYDLDCVRYRRLHGCDGLHQTGNEPKKPLKAYCRSCAKADGPGLTPFQLAWAQDPGQRRWRYYPDLTHKFTHDEIKQGMDEVGRPYQNEACNWYYKNYPSVKYDCIVRKFSK